MEDCLFCKIGAGSVPSQKLHEDEHSFSFLDINPLSKGHAMVIPKVHGGTILDLEDDVVKELFVAVKKTTALLKEKLQPDGFTIGVNHEIGQAVPHVHVHIIPRWKNDGGGNMHTVMSERSDINIEEVVKLLA